MSRASQLAMIAVLVSLAACSANPVEDRFYSLVLASDTPYANGAATNGAARLIVGPVELPDYLRRRGIAMQTGATRLHTANHHFWAEPLDEAIAKVLVRDIAGYNPGIAVDRDLGRWTHSGNCRVRLEFDGFHATGDSRVVSSGRYWVSSSEQTAVRREFSLSRTLTDDGYGHAVMALRATLDELAATISGDIAAEAGCKS